MEDTPYYHCHSQKEFHESGECPKEDEKPVYVKDDEQFSAKSAGERRTSRSEDQDNNVDVRAHADTDPSPNVDSIPMAEEASTDSPQNTSPSSLASTETLSSIEDHSEPVQDSNKSEYGPLSANNTIVEQTDPSKWTPKILPTGVRPTKFSSRYTPSPLAQSPMNTSALEIEMSLPRLPPKAFLPRARDSGHASVELGRTSKRRSLPVDAGIGEVDTGIEEGDAGIDEIDTTVNASIGDIISHTVPFQHESPPSFQSCGEAANNLARRTSWEEGDEENPAADQPLPYTEGSEGSQHSSSPPAQSRKRKSSSSPPSPPSSKRSRTSTPEFHVFQERLPLLFVLLPPNRLQQHRHVVVSLPTSWYEFHQLAIQVFARGSCYRDIPTKISDQAKFVMRWNKLTNHAYWDTFPAETELHGGNINAVLKWMLHSGSYDFCEIQNEQEAEAVPGNNALSAKSDTGRHRQDKINIPGTIAGTALGCDGGSENTGHEQEPRTITRRNRSSEDRRSRSENLGREHQSENNIENVRPTNRTRSNTVVHRPQAKLANDLQEEVEDESEK